MHRYFCGFIVVLLAYSQVIIGAELTKNEEKNYLFVGNPGVGKSAIINALFGKVVAKSGLNPGVGLTKFFSEYKLSDKKLLDTPGLADIKLRKQAAEEIEKALKRGGEYHIFFVFTLQGLRVLDQDIASMNLILDAIECKEIKFNVIINSPSKQEFKRLQTSSDDLAVVSESVNSGKHKTQSIWIVPRDADLYDGDKEFFDIDNKAKDFIFNKSLSMSIDKENVHPIEWNQFEKFKEESEKNIQELKERIKNGDENHLNLVRELDRAKEALSNLQGDGGFWETLGTIVGTIGSVVLSLV
jgi:GTP-binding protein EngB required for normal cell division